MSSKKIVVAFDLYGTLLSTDSIAKQLAEHFGQEKGQTIAALWRRYQLEYTWRLNSMGRYDTFSNVTRNSLQHTLRELKLSLDDGEISSLMKAYDFLSTFPDVSPALKSLSSNPSVTAVVFSNGTSAMVTASVTQSPGLSPHASTFQDLISIEAIKMFKPTPEAYMYLAQKVGKEKSEMGDMFLISGNPFDVVGARATGMKAIWVDRPGNGWVDALVERERGPTAIVRSLEEVPSIIEKYSN